MIIPISLRSEMLGKIHWACQGPESSIRRAREAMFWPGMQAAIRDTCQACGTCTQYLAQRPAEPMKSHDIPVLPWQKISIDLFCLDGKSYLVTVDHYSDFFELYSCQNSDKSHENEFDNLEYTQFAKEYGFMMIKSSPYHSQGNGKAEAAVKVAKTHTWLCWPTEIPHTRTIHFLQCKG